MTDRENRVLILGASSFIGRHLFARMGPRRAIGTYNATPIDGGVKFNALTMRISAILDEPESISHAVILMGDTEPDSCIADADRSRKLNVESIRSVIDQLAELGIKPVFTSSEYVFDGTKGDYVETDPASPILLYGAQKRDIERYLEGLGISWTILRFAKVFGDDPDDQTLFTGWIEALRGTKEIRCASDQMFSPVYIADIVEAIMRATEQNFDGLYHVSGNRRFRRIELLEMLLKALRRYRAMDVTVLPCSIHDFDLPEKRPADVSMNADKLIATSGIILSDIEEMCVKIAATACDRAEAI